VGLGDARSLRGVQVSASPDANCQQPGDPLKMMMNRERAAAAREAKLELIREQVSSGALVIREMTKTERAKWAKQHATLEAKLTPAERTGRAAALKERHRRAHHRRAREQ
jgi:hypothetical protein